MPATHFYVALHLFMLFQMNSAIVPTKVLTEPAELERILQSGLHATSGLHTAHAAANGYSFDTPAAFGAESYNQVITI